MFRIRYWQMWKSGGQLPSARPTINLLLMLWCQVCQVSRQMHAVRRRDRCADRCRTRSRSPRTVLDSSRNARWLNAERTLLTSATQNACVRHASQFPTPRPASGKNLARVDVRQAPIEISVVRSEPNSSITRDDETRRDCTLSTTVRRLRQTWLILAPNRPPTKC